MTACLATIIQPTGSAILGNSRYSLITLAWNPGTAPVYAAALPKAKC